MDAARSAAERAASTSRRACSFWPMARSANAENPSTPCSALLISWATPPASRPTASIRCAASSASWACRRSVRSRTKKTPSFSLPKVAPPTSTAIRLPSFRKNSFS